MHCFITRQQLQGDEIRLTDERTLHHLQVQRKRVGDEISCCVWEAGQAEPPERLLYRAVIASLTREQLIARVVATDPSWDPEPARPIVIAQAWIKQPRWEWMLQKATELGAAGCYTFAADRSQPMPELPKREQRWQHILHDAAVQSRRGCIPALGMFADLHCLLQHFSDHECLLADPCGQDSNQNRHHPSRPLLLILGPEGGFTAAEVEQARHQGGKVVALGPRILRAETAALAFLAAVLCYEGELGGVSFCNV